MALPDTCASRCLQKVREYVTLRVGDAALP